MKRLKYCPGVKGIESHKAGTFFRDLQSAKLKRLRNMQFLKKIIFLTTTTAVFVLTFTVTAVIAHEVELLESIPANGDLLPESPSEVVARYSEELVSGESTLTVINAQGVQVDNGDGGVDLHDPDHASMIASMPTLPNGVYTVQWHAVLLDGDATDGAFTFTIGDEPVDAPNEVSAETNQAGLSTSIITAIGVSLVTVLFVAVLLMRRRQA